MLEYRSSAFTSGAIKIYGLNTDLGALAFPLRAYIKKVCSVIVSFRYINETVVISYEVTFSF